MQLPEITAPLLCWYDKNARILPWRRDKMPYHIWLSEIMLQQTRVETVIPYYERFLAALPDISSLADAPEDELLKLWQGLGYYNRVRTMQKAARIIKTQYDGELPVSFSELLLLPGFGEYTAGAVGSIAFGLPTPAVDGNVMRVVARLTASEADVSDSKVKAEVTKQIQKILPVNRAGDFNQALMDLGATVCLPNGTPKCEECPVQSICNGKKLGVAEFLPHKAKKPERRIERRTVLLLFYKRKIAIRKRPDSGLLASLWEFPNFPLMTCAKMQEMLKKNGLEAVKISPLKPAKHIFSHLEWQMSGYAIWTKEQPQDDTLVWADEKELQEKYSIPSAFRAYSQAAFGLLKNEIS